MFLDFLCLTFFHTVCTKNDGSFINIEKKIIWLTSQKICFITTQIPPNFLYHCYTLSSQCPSHPYINIYIHIFIISASHYVGTEFISTYFSMRYCFSYMFNHAFPVSASRLLYFKKKHFTLHPRCGLDEK